MQERFLNNIYFSATGTTSKCVATVAEAIGMPLNHTFNMADKNAPESMRFSKNEIVLVGTPVYGGRIPKIFARKLDKLHGDGAKAIAMVVYGNRDYDDALLELTDILRGSGFNVMAAGAFIAQHSIFPKTGISRPDKNDIDRLIEFGRFCRESINRTDIPDLLIKGNRPYKTYGSVPIHPTGDKDKCNECGRCSALCPADAIVQDKPWMTDNSKCISCGRCIVSCPASVRRYRGFKYKVIGKIFTTAFARRKEPEFFI